MGYRLTVNGQEVPLQQNQQTTLSSQEQITAYYGGDYTVTINTPSSRITHSGQMVEIEEKGTADGSHSGLCGDYNNDRRADLKSPKYETKETPVDTIFSSGHRDSYSVKKHSYIYKEDKLCISQDPVVQCRQGSIPQSMKKKTIKFVCLPEGRISKLYSDRIERGESPQELKHQPVDFTAEMDQPVICGPAQL